MDVVQPRSGSSTLALADGDRPGLPPAHRTTGPGEAPALRAGTTRWRARLGLLLPDAAVILAAALVAGGTGPVVGATVTLLVLASAGLYRQHLVLSVLDDVPAVVRAVVAGCGAGALTSGAVAGTLAGRPFAAAAVLALLGLLVVRAATYARLRALRRRGARRRALVVGCGELGGRLAGLLRDSPELGLDPVGFVDEAALLPPDQRPVPLLGRLRDLPAVLPKAAVDVVIVAFGDARESAAVDVLRSCDRLDVEVLVVPRFYELHSRSAADERLCGISLVRLRRPAFRAPTWPLKRVVDIVLSGAALLLLAPVLAVCTVAVRRESGAGVLFRQERIGLDGRPFTLLKLQSLRPASATESATRWSIVDDDRLGPVGRFLRATSLDEVPQLWNVLRGDMSLVGPRPERPHFVERFSLEHEEYAWRHRVPVGLTGWAQVNGLRGDTSIPDRARHDNDYVENWSLWWDLSILVRTVGALRRGA